MFANNTITENVDDVVSFLKTERGKALSYSEWKFRMRGYGYNLRRTETGTEVARLPQNRVIGTFQI